MYSLVIVDDDYEIRKGLTNYFPWKDLGFEVAATFEDAEKLLTYLATHKVDVILCDIKLPTMSGIEIAEKLFELGITSKIIFLSAYSDYDYMRSAIQLQAVDYILKPTNYQELSRLFISLKQELDNTSTEEPVSSSSARPIQEQVIEAVKTYLKINYREATLALAADVVKMNPNYLSRFFKEHSGCSFSDYLMQVRMEKARELLNNYQLRTYEVSDMIGYTDSNNFSRAFTRYFGMSPRTYRTSVYDKD